MKPPLTGSPNLGLVDFIVKRRLFNFFLNLGCVPLTDDNKLMKKIALSNPWPRPVTVYGYDDTIAVEGDLFEAETDCVNDLGQVNTNGCANLAFYRCGYSRPVNSVLAEWFGQSDIGLRASDANRRPAFNPRTLQRFQDLFDTNCNAVHARLYTIMTLVVQIGDGDNVNFMKGGRFDWMKQRVQLCKQEPKVLRWH